MYNIVGKRGLDDVHCLRAFQPSHKETSTSKVLVNKALLTGTVPVNKDLLTGTVPVNKELLTRTFRSIRNY